MKKKESKKDPCYCGKTTYWECPYINLCGVNIVANKKYEAFNAAVDAKAYEKRNSIKAAEKKQTVVRKSVCNCKVCGKETDFDLIDNLCPSCW